MGDADRGPEVTDREILAAFAQADETVRHDEDVADDLPISTELLADRLDDLHERDLVTPADEDLPGRRWRLTPAGLDEAALPESEVETGIEAQATKTTGAETPPREAETPASPPPDPQADEEAPFEGAAPPTNDVADEIEAFDPPGTPRQTERRRMALRRAYASLQKRGTATRDDLVADVYATTPADYDDPDEWWSEVVRPGLETLPDVEGDGDEWRFVGEVGGRPD